MIRKLSVCATLVAFLSLISATQPSVVNAQSRIWIAGSGGGLGSVELETGVVHYSGDLQYELLDIAFSPEGVLYGISEDFVFTVNKDDASLSFVGEHGLGVITNALIFDSSGNLYSAAYDTTLLYSIDPNSGVGSTIGDIGYKSSGDLAFQDDILYMTTTDNNLIQVDPGSGAGTLIGPTNHPSIWGMAKNDDGQMYGVSGYRILTIDTATAETVQISNYQGDILGSGLGAAFEFEATAVPEPSSVAIFCLVGAGLLLRRRR